MSYPKSVLRLALERTREYILENSHTSLAGALFAATNQIEQQKDNASQLYAETRALMDESEKLLQIEAALQRLGE